MTKVFMLYHYRATMQSDELTATPRFYGLNFN